MMERGRRGTGTNAQISGVRGGRQDRDRADAKGAPPLAWFVAFAPADNPKIAVAVVVEDGGTYGEAASGGRVAAPIARKVMEAVVHR